MEWLKNNLELKVVDARILLAYKAVQEAEAVAKAVSPDNIKTPQGMSVETIRRGRKVLTRIECRAKLLTFTATIDDFMSAVSVAERSIQAMRKC